MQRQRFELKYVIPEAIALGIREFADAQLELDEFGRNDPVPDIPRSYPVNSIYLDSDRMSTYWDWVNADRNRYKLRVRFYDERSDTLCFFELKRRVSNCILKQRCAVWKPAAPMIIAGHFPPRELIKSKEDKNFIALERFIDITLRIQAKPKLLVTYFREAYIDPNNDGVRLTLDRVIRMSPRHSIDFSLHGDKFVQPFGEKVILELKFNNRFPDWFGDLTRIFNLTRDGAAKYCEGVSSLYKPQLGNWREGGGE
jgi:SPX domain protein involved in polyphosphate accumulation